MKFCSKCGKEIIEEAVVCPHCGCAVASSTVSNIGNSADEVNIGLCVLSALIPLFGIIYWAVNAKTSPQKAKACGITALVSWGVCIMLSVFLSAAAVFFLS